MARVVFRADAGAAIGAGHAMRCLALAGGFVKAGWLIGFAATSETFGSIEPLEAMPNDRLVVSGHPDDEPGELAGRWPDADVLVLDHYGRDITFERRCRSWTPRILVMDDLGEREHDADILVDASAASASAYQGRVPRECRILYGPRHAVVHAKFRKARDRALVRRQGQAVHRVLISFGQNDAANATTRALDALDDAGFKGGIDVVLGASAPHLAAIRGRTGADCRLHVNVHDMPELMIAADLAIGAGGATAWERLCLGVPTLVVTLAENQRPVTENLHALGLVQWLGHQDAVDETQFSGALTRALEMTSLAEWSDRCLRACSGRGVFLVADRMAQSPHDPSPHHSGALPLAAES